MRKQKLIIPLLSVITVLLTACSSKNPVSVKTESSSASSKITSSYSSDSTLSVTSSSKPISSSKESAADNTDENIAQKTKEYITNGQKDKSEAEKLKWSTAFLDKADIKGVYRKYIAAGGKTGDIESFAEYLTKNAPVLNNWKEIFETDFANSYNQKITRYEPLQDNLYQVYIKSGSSEVPFVVVNARTGYFHG
ncbi:MAG TPA: hypothetical protein VHO66_09875 [Ruminiclostridium sp.]|nr:hypothetical protein [Ruminiclostridium sp.]